MSRRELAEARASRRHLFGLAAMAVATFAVAVVGTSAGAAPPEWTVETSWATTGDTYALTVSGNVPPSCSSQQASLEVTLGDDLASETADPVDPRGGPFTVTFEGLADQIAHTISFEVLDGPGGCQVPTGVKAGAPPAWVDQVLPAGASLTATYDDAVLASGNPAPTYALSVGALPPGLALDTATGKVTGTPTAVGAKAFTLTATNEHGSIQAPFTITVVDPNAPVLSAPVWTDQIVENATVGIAYADGVAASGNPTPTYAVATGSTLPSGLALDTTTGALTGTPDEAGRHPFTLTATNSQGTIATDLVVIVTGASVLPDPGTVNPSTPTPAPAPAPVPAPAAPPAAPPAVEAIAEERPAAAVKGAAVTRELAKTGSTTQPLAAAGFGLVLLGVAARVSGARRASRA